MRKVRHWRQLGLQARAESAASGLVARPRMGARSRRARRSQERDLRELVALRPKGEAALEARGAAGTQRWLRSQKCPLWNDEEETPFCGGPLTFWYGSRPGWRTRQLSRTMTETPSAPAA